MEPDVTVKIGHIHSIEFIDRRFTFPYVPGQNKIIQPKCINIQKNEKINKKLLKKLNKQDKIKNENLNLKNEINSNSTSLSTESIDSCLVCSVCLDSIVATHEAMITILCQHHFHFSCLSKWLDSTCPVKIN
jgi:hypothetical protein